MSKNNKNEEVNFDKIRQVINSTYQLNSEKAFDPFVWTLLERITQRRGVSVDYALPAIISTVGALLGKATIDSLGTKLGCCFYTLLAAQPSTGKSAAQSLSQEALTTVESYFIINTNESIQVNAPTIEAFFRIMSKHPCVLGNFDEAAQFFSAMGRYNKGDKDYDQAFYNNLWNTPLFIQRDLSTERNRINNPRCNLTMAIHLWTVITNLTSCKGAYDDGFYHRLIITAPKPSQHNGSTILNCPPIIIQLHAIFLFIFLMHKTTRHYYFAPQATELLVSEFDKYMRLVDISNKFDFFLGSMFGKSNFILTRFCLFIYVLHFSCELIKNIAGCDDAELTVDFVEACTDVVKSMSTNDFIINKKFVEYALELTEYVTKNKLILAGYDIDINETVETNFIKLYKSKLLKPIASGDFAKADNLVLRRVTEIILYPKSEMFAKDIIGRNGKIGPVNEAFDLLEKNGLGTTKIVQAENKVHMKRFRKIKYEELIKNPNLINAILQTGLDAKTVEKLLVDTENKENEAKLDIPKISHQNKRKPELFSESIEPNSKKSHKSNIVTGETIIKQNHFGLPFTLSHRQQKKLEYMPTGSKFLIVDSDSEEDVKEKSFTYTSSIGTIIRDTSSDDDDFTTEPKQARIVSPIIISKSQQNNKSINFSIATIEKNINISPLDSNNNHLKSKFGGLFNSNDDPYRFSPDNSNSVNLASNTRISTVVKRKSPRIQSTVNYAQARHYRPRNKENLPNEPVKVFESTSQVITNTEAKSMDDNGILKEQCSAINLEKEYIDQSSIF